MNQEKLQALHQTLLSDAQNYRQAQARIIDHLQVAEQNQLHTHMGYSSMFEYVTKALNISEQSAYNFIGVARKSMEVKELKEEIRLGRMGVSKARKLCSLLKPENKDTLLPQARVMSTREIEEKVREQEGKPKQRESIRPLGEGQHQITLVIDSQSLEQILHLQDLLSSSKKTHCQISEALGEATKEYINRHDPLQKAKRTQQRRERKEASTENREPRAKNNEQKTIHVNKEVRQGRSALPAHVLNAVNARDERRCTFVGMKGKRCNQRRWLHIHHRLPVSHGGKHEIDNLITLCEAHHRLIHKNDRPKSRNKKRPYAIMRRE